MKYFILGVLSTAILLYGMSLLFGLTGEITFAGLAEATLTATRGLETRFGW